MKKKSIGKIVSTVLILIAIIPILITVVSSYISTRNLLIERTDSDKQTAVASVAHSRNSLKQSAKKALDGMASQPAFKQKFDLKKIKKCYFGR